MALRVFLVEDSQVMREHLTDRLTTEAAIELVGTADTEAQATEWMAKNSHRWDVALVDLMLREGSGAGVVGSCRRRPGQSILVMSGYDAPPLLNRCKLLGAAAVYDKSTNLDEMLAYCFGMATEQPRHLGTQR